MRVSVTIDRPIGYIHHGHAYEVNYGFVPGVIGGDMHEQDAYILDSSIDYPIDNYVGDVIAVAVREDDVETKWIVSNEKYTADEIYEKIIFFEQYFKTKVFLIENFPADKL